MASYKELKSQAEDLMRQAEAARKAETGAALAEIKAKMAAFEQASSRAIPCRIGQRRAGDVAQCWADPGLAQELLGWKADRGLEQMCADAWRWQQQCERHVAGR